MRKIFKKLSAITLAVFSFGLCGCVREKKIASAEISKSYERKISVQTGETPSDFKNALCDFSFELFQDALQNKKENPLVSPLSAYLCLCLIANGTSGETLVELDQALGLTSSVRNQAASRFVSSLVSQKDSVVEIANSVWIKQNTITVKEDFLQTNADYFAAQVYASPFDYSTVQDINNWCYNHTGGQIDKLFDSIPQGAVAYLINTLHFDCKWETPYQKEDINLGIFNQENGEERETNFLSSKENIYLSFEGGVGFAKPYKNGNYSFVALLPDENKSANHLASSLCKEKWETIWHSQQKTSVIAAFPEFAFEQELDLQHALKKMGVTQVFDPVRANFNALSKQPLFLSAIKQKVKIEVNAKGTKAAAVTWGEVKMNAAPIEEIRLVFNRPFVYAIVENNTGIPLFLGIVHRL